MGKSIFSAVRQGSSVEVWKAARRQETDELVFDRRVTNFMGELAIAATPELATQSAPDPAPPTMLESSSL